MATERAATGDISSNGQGQAPSPGEMPQLWYRYRHNLIRHLTAVARHSERLAMSRLTARGYPRLAMSFAGPVTLLAQRPQRLTELAATLGISKQLCLQTLRPLEDAGYIERAADAADRRAKLVGLNERGRSLVVAGMEELSQVEGKYAELIGASDLAELGQLLLNSAVLLEVPGFREQSGITPQLNLIVSALTRCLHERLMRLVGASGHNQLQMSFSQVLTLTDLRGTSLNQLATLNGVSPAAISRIAGELEKLGYVQRIEDSRDRRSKRLTFTVRGLALIADSVAAMQQIEQQWEQQLGRSRMRRLRHLARALYDSLAPERGVLKDYDAQAVASIYGAAPQRRTAEAPALAEFLDYVSQRCRADNGTAPALQQWLQRQLGAKRAQQFEAMLAQLQFDE